MRMRWTVPIALAVAIIGVQAGVNRPVTAAAVRPATTGTVALAGNQWFGGNGVPVCNLPTWSTCGGQPPVGSAGQCVELAQRFYQARGWYHGNFRNVAAAIDIYTNASGLGMSRQAQGSITSVAPGDMLVFSGGSTIVNGHPAGHVAIVDSITVNTDGSRILHTVNQNAKTVRLDARWHGGLVDSFWSDHTVAGVVHDPDNHTTGTGGGGSATYPDISDGGGTRLVGADAYLDVTSIGQVYAWNNAYFGGQPAGNTGITDVAMAPGDGGYWMVDSVGHVYAYPSSNPYYGGSPAGVSGRIVSIASRPDGQGYWLMSQTGQVYAYPSSNPYYGGSPGGYAGTFVAIESTPSGHGYWLVTSAGQVYAYGDAQWLGNATGFQQAIVGISRTPGNGYVLVSITGQVYAYGDAQYYGNVPSIVGNAADISYALPGMAGGYLIISTTGAHYAFGSAPFINNPTGFTGSF